MRQICVEPVFIRLVVEELIQLFKRTYDSIWNGLMRSDDCKW